MAQRREDSSIEQHSSYRHARLKYGRLTRQRAPGGRDHPGLANRATKKLRPLLLPAIIALSIAVVGLHVAGGLILLKTGLSGFALQGPLAYIVIGLFAIVALFKLTHVVGVVHRNGKKEDAEE